ncbi:GlsB/YeaQ/YmgE family stress response membrane protein [Kocuria palustris]|uniref:GlsB/YeaQ/YmgE family stress response membrane protein n=1 Tax=Kocuria palustris TaxID=71999 RepID=UPI0011AA3710|nr:GlsB/YeaQ/YmgE family stress response membrane protein [Kocuria palustris]
MLWTIIAWIILGIIAGAIAKLIMPGKQGGGIVMTMILGIIGAFVGGLIAMVIPGLHEASSPLSIGSIVLAIIGALVVLFIYGALTKGSRGGAARGGRVER